MASSKPDPAPTGASPKEWQWLPRPKYKVQPNCMGYQLPDGSTREIYLAKGTIENAVRLLEEENWEELGKFPPYTGQGYTAEDHMLNVSDDDTDPDTPQAPLTESQMKMLLSLSEKTRSESAESEQKVGDQEGHAQDDVMVKKPKI